jgi:hypothetical protein
MHKDVNRAIETQNYNISKGIFIAFYHNKLTANYWYTNGWSMKYRSASSQHQNHVWIILQEGASGEDKNQN